MRVDYVDYQTIFWYNNIMKRIINIGNKKKATQQLEQFKNKQYESVDLEFTNVHLTTINDLIGYKFFVKNSLFARSSMLWEAMQPIGDKGRHNYHGLEPNEIVDALANLTNPHLIYESYYGRYVIVVLGNDKYPFIMMIIELNAGLTNNRNANINKLVTIYPKSDLDKTLKKIMDNKIVYKK